MSICDICGTAATIELTVEWGGGPLEGTKYAACADPVCASLLSRRAGIGEAAMTGLQEEALIEASKSAGRWLNAEGLPTDLATLRPHQYQAYLRTFLMAYGLGLQSSVAAYDPSAWGE